MKNTSRLLFNEEPITINRLAARVLGLNEAIVIQQIHYWLEINRKAKINQYDDRTWTYNTYEKWQNENFDFWSIPTLKRIFKSLFDKEILLKANYNVKKYDKTLWVSLNYDKLDEILDKYEENVGISTEYQNDTRVETLEFQQSIKMIPSIVSNCNYGECQNDTTYTKDCTETSSETSFTTQSEQNVPVVETNKELIESKTHLLLDSKNKRDKVVKWNKNRLLKAIEVFIEKEGQYFSLLEKIYKDDKNFVPGKASKTNIKTRFHNINQTFTKYTPDELENLLKENQETKQKQEDIKEEMIEITEEMILECRSNVEYFEALDENIKNVVKDYVSKNCLYIPLHLQK